MAGTTELRLAGEKYLGLTEEPADFDAFWASRAARAAGPREVRSAPAGIESPMAIYSQLTFAATDGAWLHARAIVPTAPGAHPCVLVFHDMDRGPRGWFHLTRFTALGLAVVELERRPWGGGVTAGWQEGPQGLELAQLVDDALVCAQVARGLDGVDGARLATWGEGLGGMLAVAVAALAPESVVRCAAHNPMPADFRGAWESGASGLAFSGVVRHFREEDPTAANADALFSALAYVDGTCFSPRVRAELLVGTGLMDADAPPLTQYALVNRATCPVRHVTYPKHAHERVNDFENRLLAFLQFGERRESAVPEG